MFSTNYYLDSVKETAIRKLHRRLLSVKGIITEKKNFTGHDMRRIFFNTKLVLL
jgi:hypothetical protein